MSSPSNAVTGGFSNKLIADYIELTNGYLDSLTFHDVSQFEIVKSRLSDLFNEKPLGEMYEDLKPRISALKDLVDNPDSYVEDPQNYEQFRGIVKARIALKIAEIEGFSPEDKKKYIEAQRELVTQSLEGQKIMQQAVSPREGDDSHVLTGEAWTREVDRQTEDLLNGALPAFSTEPLRFPLELNFSMEDQEYLNSLTPEVRSYFTDHLQDTRALLNAGVSTQTMAGLEPRFLGLLLSHSFEIRQLLRQGVPFSIIAGLESNLQTLVITHPWGLRQLMEAGVTFETIAATGQSILAQFFRSPENTIRLIEGGVPYTEITALSDSARTQLITNTEAIQQAIESRATLQSVPALEG